MSPRLPQRLKTAVVALLLVGLGMFLAFLIQERAAMSESGAAKRAWGDAMQAVDATAEVLVAWGNEHGRLPENLNQVSLSPQCRGALYFVCGEEGYQKAYVTYPIQHTPSHLDGPVFIFLEIRRPISKTLPPGFMTRGMRGAMWPAFQTLIAGKQWLVEVAP